MTTNASPDLPDLPTPARPRLVRTAAVLVAAVLLAGVAAVYQLEFRSDRGPSFSQGGEFLSVDDFPGAGTDGRGYPYGDVTQPTVADTTASTGAPTTAATAPAATPRAGAPGTTSTSAAPAPAAAAPSPPSAPKAPATGTYSYAVTGEEGATGFGNRSYPERASIVVHRDPGLRADELVHDLRLSDQHEEREIVRYGPQGVAFSFEGGSITFGPGTQTSQATYEPLMVQIPFPLVPGATASGASKAKVGESVARTESWTAKVVGQEELDVLGARRSTWVVDVQRTTPAGSAERVDRFRRYWYDPELGTWVRWTERFHASRNMLIDFSYRTEYTATLVGFRPA